MVTSGGRSASSFAHRRTGVAAIALCVAAGVAFLWLRSLSATASTDASTTRPRPAARKHHDDEPVYSELQKPDEPPNFHAGERREPDPNQPVINNARVEKTEVCRGEENFVDVDATTKNGTDAFLVVNLVDPRTGSIVRGGSRIPFRLDAPNANEIKLVIEGKNSAKTIKIPAVKVKDCDAPQQLTLDYQRTADAPERIHFGVTLNKLPEKEPRVVPGSYEWDFGDGKSETTSEPSSQHSYEDRDQSVAQSSFLVSVTLKTERGEVIRGSRLIAFPNLGFVPLVFENKVVLSVGVSPPGPEKGASERIWLYHGYSKTVRLTKASLREVLIDPITHAETETFKREYAPGTLLGFSEIPPKQNQAAHDLSGVQPTEERAVRFVEVSGVTDDGKMVVGSFSLLPVKATPNTEGNVK